MRIVLGIWIILTGTASASAQDVKVANKTIKQWSAAMRSSDARVRYKAVAELYEEGADAAPLVKELIPLLKDPQAVIRRAVAQTLANCRGEAAPAVPALVAALRDSDFWVRQLASAALNEIGETAADPLIKLLDDKDATTRYYAVMVINGLGLQNKDILKAFMRSVKDSSPLVRQGSLFALSKIETDDAEVFTILGAALADKEKQVRLSAASILVGMGKEGAGALAKVAEDKDAASRMLALQALASLGDNIDEKGVKALRKSLDDADLKVRQTAMLGLANLGKIARELGGDKEMFQAVAKLISDKDVQLRRTAVYALGQIGAMDAEEIKTIAGALKDSDAMVRSFTIQALAKNAKETEVEAVRQMLNGHLVDTLQDKDRRVQFMAAQALTQQGALAVESLIKVIEDGKGMQRLWAAAILGEIGPGTFDAIAPLEKMAKDGNADARRVATIALQKIMGEVK
ncbi:MAG: HEAT repeat domain-containing protein [Planctomycetes bacterium]|nr:HEAT repeat domain-containing protein [Planctomycetota bacterium]